MWGTVYSVKVKKSAADEVSWQQEEDVNSASEKRCHSRVSLHKEM